MAFLSEYGMFLLKALTVLIVAAILIRVLVRAATRDALPGEGRLRVRKLNRIYQRLGDKIRSTILPRSEVKRLRKQRKAEAKQERDAPAKEVEEAGEAKAAGRVYVLRFVGDIRASAVESLRREVTAILAVAEQGDEVLIRLDSSGGVVHAYGLAASQLERLRSHDLRLTAVVDKIAASGGYLMACVADRILAAPFAVVGSIGVAAMVPNFHRLLKKHDVDVEMITGGEYKRTLTLFGENTDKGRAKFTEQVDEAHQLFKQFVARYRPSLDLEKVGTGEHWYGSQAEELGLVDGLSTSDDYLLSASERSLLYEVSYEPARSIGGRLSTLVDATARRMIDSGLQASQDSRYP